jgi:hypothetical protein
MKEGYRAACADSVPFLLRINSPNEDQEIVCPSGIVLSTVEVVGCKRYRITNCGVLEQT